MFGRSNIFARFFYISFLSVLFSFNISAVNYYVTADGLPSGTGKWSSGVMQLDAALAKAVAGDSVFLLGYSDFTGADAGKIYIAPESGFQVKAGVSVFGGYAPDGTRPTTRGVMRFKYRSVLTADIMQDDLADRTYVIFPQNVTRDDNVVRVLDIDVAGTGNVVIDGLIIEGANADNLCGGGVYIHASSAEIGKFFIRNCFINNNYALQGGGIYVDATCTAPGSQIRECLIANNVAGDRETERNLGAGICSMGVVDIVNSVINNNKGGGVLLGNKGSRVINVTFARNSVVAVSVDRNYTDSDKPDVYNSVMWNNETLSSAIDEQGRMPDFFNCAALEFPKNGDGNNNIYINQYNALETEPSSFFTVPSELLGYEFSYSWQGYEYPHSDWSISERSALCDRGDNDVITTSADVVNDMNGNSRTINGRVDIGAFEAAVADQSKIFYVRADGDNKNDGKTWSTAKKDVQAAIEVAAAAVYNSREIAEVWIAEGIYYPTLFIPGTEEMLLSFRMHDRVNVYGGFAGTESAKNERKKQSADGMPWQYEHKTVLCGAGYVSGTLKWNENLCRWNDMSSNSAHVVWHAPLKDESQFSVTTILEGVTIMGGNATARLGIDEYYDEMCGGGVYLGSNAMIENCIVTECVATDDGGAVYIGGAGRVRGSLICSNSAAKGGGVYINDDGGVSCSMIVNNGADNGAAVYMRHRVKDPNDLLLVSSVISNNTVTENGAVFCDGGGMVVHCTLTNNKSVGSTDLSDPTSPRTGGLYVDSYVYMVNSVLWNNYIGNLHVQAYLKNPSKETAQFYNTAISNKSMIVWNNTIQSNLFSLSEDNRNTSGNISADILEPDFISSMTDIELKESIGVSAGFDRNRIPCYWIPSDGSALRSKGLPRFGYVDNALIKTELDLKGEVFARKPALGAFHVNPLQLMPVREDNRLVLYVNNSDVNHDADGSSWQKAHRSLNEALSYFSGLSQEGRVPNGVDTLEVRVLEGEIVPSFKFNFNELRSAAIEVGKSDHVIKVVGGYSAADVKDGNIDPERMPVKYRTVIHGNRNAVSSDDALFHCIRVDDGANVVFDGIYVAGANALNDRIKYGAGVLVNGKADVQFRNSMFINCSAINAAAVYAPAAGVVMVNSVVCNNSNTSSDDNNAAVVAGSLELIHSTFANNACKPYSAVGGISNVRHCLFVNNNGFSEDIPQVTPDNISRIFLNPTTNVGASLHVQTYGGVYPSFVPLTSSDIAGQHIINRVTEDPDVAYDLQLRPRNLGGASDLGAYEAELLPKGRVYYVRTPETGGNDANDGLSWNTAFATVGRALVAADAGEVIGNAKPEVWVAAGVYRSLPKTGSQNCFVIREGVNVYGAFPPAGCPAKSDRHPLLSQYIRNIGGENAALYETILQPESSTRGVGRVLGQTDDYNPISTNRIYRYVNVGNENGDHIIIQRDLEFLNGLPDGFEGMKKVDGYEDVIFNESGYRKYFARADREDVPESYFGIIEIGKINLVYVGTGKGDRIITKDSRDRDIYNKVNFGEGDYVQFESPGWQDVHEDVDGAVYVESGKYKYCNVGDYVYVGQGNGNFAKTETDNKSFYPTEWDGFTVRGGSLNSNGIRFLDKSAYRNGGGGVLFFNNVSIRNFVITENENYSSNSSTELRGGAVYCDGGLLANSYIIGNRFGDNGQETAYGGGCYMFSGTAYNCVVARNESFGKHTDGAGIFIENAEFYNNTIVQNVSHGTTRGNGGICIWHSGSTNVLNVYNCIVVGNEGKSGIYVDSDVATAGGTIRSYNSIYGNINIGKSEIQFEGCIQGDLSIFNNTDGDMTERDYRLNGSAGLNTGLNMPQVGDKVVNLFDYTDMDYTDRIKDCTIDAGAFEYDNSGNIRPDANGVYYVTFDGTGKADASSPQSAACAMKLQDVLDAAGKRISDAGNDMSVTATVKIAGYKNDRNMIYRTARKSDPDDNGSYTYTIPYGVMVMGGFSEDFTEDDAKRNAMENATVLSPENEYRGMAVTGYHVVTFAPPAEGLPERQTVVDGLVLTGGSATSFAGGRDNTRGGAAVVPAYGHIRNCIILDCSAENEGGALYLLPGATVSGSLLYENSARKGGAVFAANEGANPDLRSHIISNTIYNNSADEGGGIYIEDGAVVGFNCVIFGNKAVSDMNVAGNVNITYADNKFTETIRKANIPTINEFFPFNKTYVETFEMPANYINFSMSEKFDSYFRNELCHLRSFSPLIRSGVRLALQTQLEVDFNVAGYDMYGAVRGSKTFEDDVYNCIDAGAFAFVGSLMTMPESVGDVIRILFVNQASTETVIMGEVNPSVMSRYEGRSFITPLSDLDKALNYITMVRNYKPEFKDLTFRVLMTGGVYKPAVTRPNTDNELVYDQRKNSFMIPGGVEIYGNFSGNEKINDKYISFGLDEVNSTDGVTDYSIPMTPLGLDDETEFRQLLDARAPQDNNNNGLFEPWEFENKTILSGNINVSAEEDNAYHVVVSNKDGNIGAVVLDGLTIIDGETADILGVVGEEIGRGGAIFSNAVDYDIRNCRFLNNKAVRGNAVFMKNASLKICESLFAGNSTVNGYDGTQGEPAGGAVYAHYDTEKNSLLVLNSVFVNNEVSGNDARGAAIASNKDAGEHCEMELMNCIVARNAAQNSVFHVPNSKVVNTVVWGNDITDDKPKLSEVKLTFVNSAADIDFGRNPESHEFVETVMLNTVNMAVDGPRFDFPSNAAGAAAFEITRRWNPTSLSVLVDAGDGLLQRTEDPDLYDENKATGAYHEFVGKYFGLDRLRYVKTNMNSPTKRYTGRVLLDDESAAEHPLRIDIGLYEYIYQHDLTKMDTIYVDVEERGNASGESWANAISSIDNAIRAVCMANGGKTTDKCIMVRSGEYSLSQLVNNVALRMIPRKKYDDGSGLASDQVTSISIKGSFGVNGIQHFAEPTVFRVNPVAAAETMTILQLRSSGVDINIEGVKFGDYEYDLDAGNPHLVAFDVIAKLDEIDNKGNVRVKNCRFVHSNEGIRLSDAIGANAELRLSNVLLADNGIGLNLSDDVNTDNLWVTNATLANNKVSDINKPEIGNIYNSVSYNNGTDNMTTDTDNANSCLSDYENNDIVNGPNFIDPDPSVAGREPDYNIRPNVTLMNTGNNELYKRVTGIAGFSDEKDLGGLSRLVSDHIDRGAFEYNSVMNDTVYVRSGVAGDNSGRDWDNAMSDLQTAVDHVGVAAQGKDKPGVVFVHPNVGFGKPLSVNLGNIKVYGSMANGALLPNDVANRKGVLVDKERSKIAAVNIKDDNVVLDGFEFIAADGAVFGFGSAEVVISTSIINGSVRLYTGCVLYNSLVLGSIVGDGKAVNCTALENIAPDVEAQNCVQNSDSVTDYIGAELWRYQLRENSTDIDNGDAGIIDHYIEMVGHDKDITGMARVRNKVDNGCFETLNIPAGEHVVISSAEIPTSMHVVYVGENASLKIDDDACSHPDTVFAPGYLLLKDGAELLGNNNFVSLSKFGVEHEFTQDVPKMLCLPFTVTDVHIPVEGKKTGGFLNRMTELEPYAGIWRYDGDKRAAHDYVFAADGTAEAWVPATDCSEYEGLLFCPKRNSVLRFMGDDYTEQPDMPKSIELKRHNYNEDWNGENGGGKHFTHAENMSWNLVGSPYLSSMNYNDMEYGRMIYKLTDNGTYRPVNTAADGVDGHLPVGNAFFTQTATLKEAEFVEIAPRTDDAAEELAPAEVLLVEIRNIADSDDNMLRRNVRGINSVAHHDNIGLRVVSHGQAESEYNIEADAVKIKAVNGRADEIYIIRYARRYSILNAVDIEGTVQVGVSVTAKGSYGIYIPEYVDAGNFHVVALHDNVTGKTVDLKETEYHFFAEAPGEINDRFSITFRQRNESGQENAVIVFSPEPGVAVVENLNPVTDACIRVFDVGGHCIVNRKVRAYRTCLLLPSDVAYLFEIETVDTVDGDVVHSVHKVIVK